MIKLQNYTPQVYYNESRDFQFLGRLFDLVLNSVKTRADLIRTLRKPDELADQYLELLALTLGFKATHKYNATHLRAICKVFPEILRNKGNINSIIIACNALFAADGLSQLADYEVIKDQNEKITGVNIYIPQNFTDTILINDLLVYVLPAGLTCNIINQLQVTEEYRTTFNFTDKFNLYNNGDLDNKMYSDNSLAKLADIKNVSEIDKIKDKAGYTALGTIHDGIIQKEDNN